MERRIVGVVLLLALGQLGSGCDDSGVAPSGDLAAGEDPTGATETNVMRAPCDADTQCLAGTRCQGDEDGGTAYCVYSDAATP